MQNLIKEFNEITKFKVFEIEVVNNRTKEKDFILFDIEINEEKNILKASHVGLTIEEEQSNKIAFKSIELDNTFSLDEHLQELYSICITAILNSELYDLTND